MDIARISPISPEDFLSTFIEPNRPVVVQDALVDWALAERWTPETLARDFGTETVPIYNKYFDLAALSTLEEYLEKEFDAPQRYQNIERPYVRWYTKLREVDFLWADSLFERFMDRWEPLSFLPKSGYVLPCAMPPRELDPRRDLFPAKGLFISGAGARTGLHVDPWGSDAVLCQLFGKKRWRMFSPALAVDLMVRGQCVDLESPDLSRFPRATMVKPTFEFELDVGEVVYVPHGWMHHVTTVTPSISITWNFVHAATKQALLRWIDEDQGTQVDEEIVRFFLGGLEGPRSRVGDFIRALET